MTVQELIKMERCCFKCLCWETYNEPDDFDGEADCGDFAGECRRYAPSPESFDVEILSPDMVMAVAPTTYSGFFCFDFIKKVAPYLEVVK